MSNGQPFLFTTSGEIVFNDLCLDANEMNGIISFAPCYKTRPMQQFRYDSAVRLNLLIKSTCFSLHLLYSFSDEYNKI